MVWRVKPTSSDTLVCQDADSPALSDPPWKAKLSSPTDDSTRHPLSTSISPLIHLLSLWERLSTHTPSPTINMSMFRTALRSSARAAGALSASSRIASVRSAPQCCNVAPMGIEKDEHRLNGISNGHLGRIGRPLELHSSCRTRPSIPEVVSGTAR